jgi:ubiquinone/menaquinone biosynthesis C-methylase UbiE
LFGALEVPKMRRSSSMNRQPSHLLPRTLEPEVMDTEAEARDYDAMDHGAVNARFCEDLLVLQPRPGRVLDVGTGTALIAIALCARTPDARVDAVDLADHMLARAVSNVTRAGLANRVRLARADAKGTGMASGAFDTVMSNSLVHHIPEPAGVLREMWRLVASGGLLFVRDLARPPDEAEVGALAERYAPVQATGDEKADSMARRQRGLFVDSLRAALTVDEVRALAAPLGVPAHDVSMTSDRHWTLAHRKP